MNECKCGHAYWRHFVMVTNSGKTEHKLCKVCDCDEQWEEAMESGDYADSLYSEIAEGIDDLYKEHGLTKSKK